MDPAASLPEVDLDALKRGEPSKPDEAALLPLVTALRAEQWHHEAPVMSAALRAEITAPPVVGPARLARRWKLVLAGAGGLLVGGATLGVAGAQGALPNTLQDATSRAATIVGFDLPTAAEADDDRGPASDDDDGTEDTPGSSDPQGPPVTTKSGTSPADPGTPGDGEPATPAEPGTGQANRGENRSDGTSEGTDNRNPDPGAGNPDPGAGNPDPGSANQGADNGAPTVTTEHGKGGGPG